MILVDWRDELKIGIDEVDFEHHELIRLINALYDHADQKDSCMAVLYFLGEIYEIISTHFALEEKHMLELNYDQYEVHKNDHEQLLNDILDIMSEYRNTSNLDKRKFSERLNKWFVQHFMTKDARLHKFLT